MATAAQRKSKKMPMYDDTIFDDTAELLKSIQTPQFDILVNNHSEFAYIDINEIVRNTEQPRQVFNEEALEEMKLSIEELGIIEPLIVRKRLDSGYDLISGDRRFQSARKAGLQNVPARILDVSDQKADRIALVENLQRVDLNPIEEAKGYYRLKSKYGMTQEEISKDVGKSRSTVANFMRILSLPEEVKVLINDGKLTGAHCKRLLEIDEKELLIEIAQKCVEYDLTVRQLAELVKEAKNQKLSLEIAEEKAVEKSKKRIIGVDALLDEVRSSIQNILGRPAKLYPEKGKIILKVAFDKTDEISDIINRLSNEV